MLAYFVTETISRLWPSNYTAPLVVTAIALIINGIFNTRMAARAQVHALRPVNGR